MKKLITLLIILSLTFTTTYAYTQEEIDYFNEIAFGLEYGKSGVIHKWDKPEITISVKGDPAEEHIKELNEVMDELSDLTNINFKIVDKNPDIRIYFINHSEFNKYITNKNTAEQNWGYFYLWWRSNNEIYRSNIYIAIDKGTIESQLHLIREELTQCMGLMNDSYSYEDSIFYQGWGTVREYSGVDKTVIKLLYNPKIKPGMTKSRIQKMFKEAN